MSGGAAEAGDARALARLLAALEDGPMRTRAAARALAAGGPEGAVSLLAGALVLARGGETALAAALGEALLAPGPDLDYLQLAGIYEAAVVAGREEVRRLLVAPGPRRRWQPPRDRDQRLAQLTLGHKKSLARGQRDPDLLARLAAEGEPSVIRELLRNPRLTEELVVRIAARRPCRPETLRCIHDAARWRRLPAVARAIAMNPYAEPELVTKLLPLLPGDALQAIGEDRGLHPVVRGLAQRLRAGSRATAPEGRRAP